MGVYQMFGRGGGIPNGGIMKPPPGAPAAWMPYVRVQDAKAAAAAATANGAKIVNGPMEVPGGDWIAQGMDPQGAMFSVHSLNPTAQKAARQPRRPRHLRQGFGGQAGEEGEAAKKAAAKKAKGEEGEGQAGEEGRKAPKPAKKKAAKKKAAKKSAKRKK